MPSKTSQPVKPLEEKKSKWRLFGKGSNKSSERIVEPNQRHSDASATGNDSHRSSATEGSLVNGSAYNTSPPEAHLPKSPEQRSVVATDRSSVAGLRMNGALHSHPPQEVHPGRVTTQSGIAIEKVFQPQSVLSSSSTPSVRQETYTDPVTGEVITKTITTVVTETTTTHTTKPPQQPISPPREHDIDLEEERRLATEYLAAQASRNAQLTHHGLKPPPRSRGSLKQGRTPTASPGPVYDARGTENSGSFYPSPERDQVDRWSSDHESKSSGRHSSENEKNLPQLGSSHTNPTQNSGYAPRNDDYRQPVKPNENTRKVGKFNEIVGAVVLTRDSQPPPAETRIHAQSNYIDNFTTPAAADRQASIPAVSRPGPSSHGLTPPMEEQEQREANSTKRGSIASFGGMLGGRTSPKETVGAKVNSPPEHVVNWNGNGGNTVDQSRWKDNAVAKTNSVENHVSGGNHVNGGTHANGGIHANGGSHVNGGNYINGVRNGGRY
ncbi:hypothetical protein N0V82_005094 [Gnomoniopsis sp. IMI 355080]|nr:hypothetical protein N0V82_005094 [Gnomoniopsis sp. IMI 355080]